MICSFCKINYPKDFTYCMECGSILEEDKGQVEIVDDKKQITRCPSCGSEVFDGDTFCGSCGYKLTMPIVSEEQKEKKAEDTVICKYCKAINSKEDAFCSSCGAELMQDVPEISSDFISQEIKEQQQQTTISDESAEESEEFRHIAINERKFCLQCGADLDPDSQFCGFCGAAIEKDTKISEESDKDLSQTKKQICPVCGLENEPDSEFCGTCGSPIKSSIDVHEKENIEEQEALTEKVQNKEEIENKEVEENFITCKLCGEKSPVGSKFCSNCGLDF